MNGRKYPLSMFMMGLLMNIFLRFAWIFVPSVVLLIIGAFVPICRYIGAILLTLDIVLSFIEQMIIRHSFLKDSDDPEFRNFQDSMSGGNWWQNIMDMLQNKMDSGEFDEINDDEDDENDGE